MQRTSITVVQNEFLQ